MSQSSSNFLFPSVDSDLNASIFLRTFVKDVRLPKENLYRDANPFEISDVTSIDDIDLGVDSENSSNLLDVDSNIKKSSGRDIEKFLDDLKQFNETLNEKFKPLFFERSVAFRNLSDEQQDLLNTSNLSNDNVASGLQFDGIPVADVKNELAKLEQTNNTDTINLKNGKKGNKKLTDKQKDELISKIKEQGAKIAAIKNAIPILENPDYIELNRTLKNSINILTTTSISSKKDILVLLSKFIALASKTLEHANDAVKSPLPPATEVKKIVTSINDFNKNVLKWFKTYFLKNNPTETRIFRDRGDAVIPPAQRNEVVASLKRINDGFKLLSEDLDKISEISTKYKNILESRVGSGGNSISFNHIPKIYQSGTIR